MMNVLISLSNETNLPTINQDHIGVIGRALLEARGLTGEWLVDIRFVDIQTMRELNLDAQGHDEPTDVLSFPIHFATDRTDPHELLPTDGPQLLGSIVIAPEVAAAQATESGRSTDQEIEWLVEHAFHHLLGEDHDDKGHWLPQKA